MHFSIEEASMNIRTLVISALVAIPAAVSTQGLPALQAPVATMKANVGKVSSAGERERWQANASLWEIRAARTNKLEAADIAKMRPVFDAMGTNVSKISDPAEKERWQANCEMWRVLLNQTDRIEKPAREQMRSWLAVMTANVAKIGAAAERERWDANRELWTLLLRLT